MVNKHNWYMSTYILLCVCTKWDGSLIKQLMVKYRKYCAAVGCFSFCGYPWEWTGELSGPSTPSPSPLSPNLLVLAELEGFYLIKPDTVWLIKNLIAGKEDKDRELTHAHSSRHLFFVADITLHITNNQSFLYSNFSVLPNSSKYFKFCGFLKHVFSIKYWL